MHEFSQLVLFIWPAVAVAVFLAMGTRRGLVAVMISGVLFLPVDRIELQGFIDLSKTNVVCLSCLIGAALTDGRRLLRFRLSPWDTPMLLVCLVPVVSTLVNGFGIYASASKGIYSAITLAVPYALGRIYFGDSRGRSQLLVGIILGTAAYVPLCLYEVRMSPTLHHDLYGFNQHDFAQTFRGGGFRPMVFMDHGLQLALWLATATMSFAVLTFSGAVHRLLYVPARFMLLVFVATLVLCKSTGALAILVFTALVPIEWALCRTRIVAGLMFGCPVAYVGLRLSGAWDGRGVVDFASFFSGERAQSLEYRLHSEQQLLESSSSHFLLGRGPEGFNLVGSGDEATWVVGDSLWINAFTTSGVLMVISLWAMFLAPCVVVASRIPARLWLRKENAPIAALVVMILMIQADCVVNSMLVPVYYAAMGSLISLARPQTPEATLTAR